MIFDKFTSHYQNILKNAYRVAQDSKSKSINIEHVMYSLLLEKGSIGCEVLKKAGIKITGVKKIVGTKKTTTPKKKNTEKSLPFSGDVLDIIKRSAVTAYKMGHYYVGTEHLVSSLLNDYAKISHLLTEHEYQKAHSHIQSLLKSTSKFADLTESFESLSDAVNDLSHTQSTDFDISPISLSQFATELTHDDVHTHIDPVIGRDNEIERLIHILSRRTKNNPVLLGEAGVGKTAIIEGLAKKIAEHDVPDSLLNKRIMAVDLTSLVSGTMYRGEFENRLKVILDEVKKDPNIIMFIDELHTIIGTGSTSGSMDAANILKPALARGHIRCIGATTFDEYKKHIEKDPALSRRFQTIHVEEPSQKQTLEILNGIKSYYETFHNVSISDEALTEAVQLSNRYITDKYFPDKAIDLIDEAAAKATIIYKKNSLLKKIKSTQKELAALRSKKQNALFTEDFDTALDLQEEESLIIQKLKKQKEEYKNKEKKVHEITPDHIYTIVSQKTNIPIKHLQQGEKKQILNLHKNLKRSIVGQDHAIESIAKSLQRSKAFIHEGKKPLGSFLFLGASGVGKTELAKQLAKSLFNDEKSLIRIDMSEFSDGHTTSKLLGSPAGYVGYGETTMFTDEIRKRPHSIILFDEIEKAHPKVCNLLLQILDEGFLTDASGKRIDFTNAIIILTSNCGSELMTNQSHLGFGDPTENHILLKEKINDYAKKILSPELVNRINTTCVFNQLTEKDYKKIINNEIKSLNKKLKTQNITIKPSSKIISHISKKSFDDNQGARKIKTYIEHYIENELADIILQDKIPKSRIVQIKLKNGIM